MIYAIYENYPFIIDKGVIIANDEFLINIYNAAMAKGSIMTWEGFLDRAIYNRMSEHLDGVTILYEGKIDLAPMVEY